VSSTTALARIACSGVLAVATLAGAPSIAQTNVPDVLTQKSGLRLEAMSRPAQTYASNCQGCHGEAGASVDEIPRLAGRVGYFARIPEGRRYLVQVPNVALNPSSDEAIAAMMNWLLVRFSHDEMPPDFEPYTADEVGRLRQERIDVAARRAEVVARLVASGQIPSAEVLRLRPAALY
jgi:cytochrome c553